MILENFILQHDHSSNAYHKVFLEANKIEFFVWFVWFLGFNIENNIEEY